MWPWEHLAVGYLAYSAFVRLRTGRPPRDPLAVVALGIASQLPDLIDKPLAWTLGVLPSGTTLGHSVLFAVPLVVVVAVLVRALGRPAIGAAFAIGYLLHLPSDLLYATVVLDAPFNPWAFAWPLVDVAPVERTGLLANVAHYLGRYGAELTASGGVKYLVAEVLLLGGAGLRWVLDGTPGAELVLPTRGSDLDPHR